MALHLCGNDDETRGEGRWAINAGTNGMPAMG